MRFADVESSTSPTAVKHNESLGKASPLQEPPSIECFLDGVAEIAAPINNNKSKNIPNQMSLNNEEESKDDSRLKLKAEASEASSLMT